MNRTSRVKRASWANLAGSLWLTSYKQAPRRSQVFEYLKIRVPSLK